MVRGLKLTGGEKFSVHPDWPWSPPASCTVGSGSFPGVKWLGCGINHPTPSSTKVKERVELHFCSSLVPSWKVIG